MAKFRRHDDDPADLDALPATPDVGVHVLSNTVFCPRAGLLAYELGQADDGEERERDSVPRQDWLPDYDEALINEELGRRWDQVWWVCRYGIWWILAASVVWATFDWILGLLLLACTLVFVPWFWRQVMDIAVLDSRRRAARQSKENLNLTDLGREERIVNWWDLRRAGFSVRKPDHSNEDKPWRLRGKPFRILYYHALRIPVVRKHRGKPELHSQHRARIAAYCHLLEVTERAQAPFGVFIFAGSYDVHIVPNSAANRRLFHDGLRLARQMLTDAQTGRRPGPPDGNQCIRCPYGLPLVRKPGKTDLHLAVLRCAYCPSRGADKKDYHSVCGDRFKWIPPHEKAAAKRLE
jgi:hypothetical protein